MERPNRKGRPNKKLVDNSISITENEFEVVEISHPASRNIKKQYKLDSSSQVHMDPRKLYDPKLLELSRKCGKILEKIKLHKSGNFFFQTNNGNPSMATIEKQLYAFHFTSSAHFLTEIRRVWKFHFMQMKSPEIYQKTLDICEYFEETAYAEEFLLSGESHRTTLKEDDNQMQPIARKTINTNKVVEHPNEKKKQINEYNPPTSIFEKPFTMNEKNQLGDNIRNMSQQQMKGMLNIVKNHNSTESNSKYFEFDIDDLPTKILRELEIYVRECQSANKTVNVSANQSTQNANPLPAKVKQVRKPKVIKEGNHSKPSKRKTNGGYSHQEQEFSTGFQ